MIKRALPLLALLLFVCSGLAQSHVPTIDDLLTLKSIGGAQISPDGKWVAYTVSYADFKQDAFITQIWMVNSDSGKSFQLTRGDKSSTGPRWSPDGRLAFLSNRVEDKNQIFLIDPTGGEARQLTKSETAINSFEWSEDGKSIAYTATEPTAPPLKERKEYYGDYEVVRGGYSYVHIWTLDLAEAMKAPIAGKQRTKKTDFSVGSFAWSPDGSTIVFSATINPDLVQGTTGDIYLLRLSDDSVRKIVDQPGPDTNPRFSPDGKQIVFNSVMGEKLYFASNSRLAIVGIDGGKPRSITDSFDENPGLLEWNGKGIYFTGLQKTASHLFQVDPGSAKITRVSQPDNLMAGSFSFTHNADRLAFTVAAPTSMSEVFVSDMRGSFAPRKLSDFNEQAKAFTLGTREVISWQSQDGTTIEGVLIKPTDFDPAKKYPLLCIIHGGPTGVDRPVLLTPDSRYYPSDIWAARGALILKVNYRGSAGYGEKFRKLNVRNLGVGDAWDVLSGVDFLIAKGWVDKNKVACMGWSQGGYISAFLTTSSDRFVAISVGAGISNWATYYYNTDITPFTINYLGNDPAEDPEIYVKTSPMSYIKKARTPTLIQHGELDRRVPIANAYELRQGLENRGVKVEMVVYKGFGHGINKPKSMRAVMQHNLSWFNHYIWGDSMPDFTAPDVPKKEMRDASQ